MRVALGIEYAGTGYSGWQRQKTGTGVQTVVERAISVVADEPVATVCAGRTDAGVHASAQVVHFDSRAERTRRGWMLGVTGNLPDNINVTWAVPVDSEFSARFSATSRTYRYLILNRPTRSALLRRRAWWVHEPLDELAMQQAAEYLEGKHDYSAFRAAACRAATPVRKLFRIQVSRSAEFIAITVTGNAFLQHMVRNITGTLVAVGKGDARPDWVRSILESRDRTQAGVAAPPHGLTLIDVTYPEQFGIPKATDYEVHPQSSLIRL